MVTFNNFFCCISLRNGAIIIAILGITGVFCGVSVCIYELIMGHGFKVVVNHNIFLIIDLIIGFAANICLLLAAKKDRPYFVLVYLLPDGILIILGFFISIKRIILLVKGADYSGAFILLLVSTAVTIFCSYIWICLYSFFKLLKKDCNNIKGNIISTEV